MLVVKVETVASWDGRDIKSLGVSINVLNERAEDYWAQSCFLAQGLLGRSMYVQYGLFWDRFRRRSRSRIC